MNSLENQEEIQFLITQEKSYKQGDTSQQKMSFNLSVTIKNSSVKNTPAHNQPQPFGNSPPNKQDNIDPQDFFQNFDKYYKIEGLTPIKFNNDNQQESPLTKFQYIDDIDISINEKAWNNWKKESKQLIECKQESDEKENIKDDNNLRQINPFSKNNNKIYYHAQDKESKSRLKQIIKQKPFKSIVNLQTATQIIKINNISPLIIGSKSKIAERKNTQIALNKKSKTICNSRKSNSAIGTKRLISSQYPSIFCDKRRITDLFKPTDSNNWRLSSDNLGQTHKNNPFYFNKDFQIHKKTKILKRRPSNPSNLMDSQHLCIVSPKIDTIRI